MGLILSKLGFYYRHYINGRLVNEYPLLPAHKRVHTQHCVNSPEEKRHSDKMSSGAFYYIDRLVTFFVDAQHIPIHIDLSPVQSQCFIE